MANIIDRVLWTVANHAADAGMDGLGGWALKTLDRRGSDVLARSYETAIAKESDRQARQKDLLDMIFSDTPTPQKPDAIVTESAPKRWTTGPGAFDIYLDMVAGAEAKVLLSLTEQSDGFRFAVVDGNTGLHFASAGPYASKEIAMEEGKLVREATINGLYPAPVEKPPIVDVNQSPQRLAEAQFYNKHRDRSGDEADLSSLSVHGNDRQLDLPVESPSRGISR